MFILLSYSLRAEVHAMELPRTIYSPQCRKLYLISREHYRLISREHCREIQCVPECSILFSYMVRGSGRASLEQLNSSGGYQRMTNNFNRE